MDRFTQLDVYYRDFLTWRSGGCAGPPPAEPAGIRSVHDEWERSLPARYHRATALHEGGARSCRRNILPAFGDRSAITPLNDLLQEIVRETSTEFVNGRVVYEFLPVDENDEDVRDKLLKRIVMILAGIEFQSMEGLEAADLEVTEDAEALLIGKTFREFEKFNVLPEYQLPILDRADGLISDLRGDDGVRKAVTEVADKLVV